MKATNNNLDHFKAYRYQAINIDMRSNIISTITHHHGWLDRVAITMSVVCAIHCLITPIILVALPIIASTFWVHEDFHLWMLFLVIPTTSLAVFTGCRKHKDRWVMTFAIVGLSLLITALITEMTGMASGCTGCSACSGPAEQTTTGADAKGFLGNTVPYYALVNTLGGLFLVAGHGRNFWLCRKAECKPQDDCC